MQPLYCSMYAIGVYSAFFFAKTDPLVGFIAFVAALVLILIIKAIEGGSQRNSKQTTDQFDKTPVSFKEIPDVSKDTSTLPSEQQTQAWTARQAQAGSVRAQAQAALNDYEARQAKARVSPAPAKSKSPYEILGIAPGASPADIKAAYRKLAEMYHPDKVAHLAPEFKEISEKRMREINAAYEAVSNGKAQTAPSSDTERDELYDEALAVVTDLGKASTSVLQRRLSIGYGRAAKILDMMEREGFIGPIDGAKPRKVLGAAYEFRERLAQRLEEDEPE